METQYIDAVVEESKQLLNECFNQFKLDEVFLCFNGGKDCTVLLDLTINVLKANYKRIDIGKELKVIYIRTEESFKEIEQFVKQIEIHYGLKLIVMEGDMKMALHRILENDCKLKATLMGTRKTDPYSEGLCFMQKTDPNWPQVVRVSPLLNWSYHQIWSYILQKQVPYCGLYDIGYTSIGSIHNTAPNESLAYKNRSTKFYHPAWMLANPELERAGRGPTNGHIKSLSQSDKDFIKYCHIQKCL